MDKRKLSKILILAITAFFANTAFGVEEELLLGTESPLTVSIEKHASSVESATVNPETGVNTGIPLSSAFTLRTNGTDDDYDFIMTAEIPAEGGTASGYAQIGGKNTLLFGNTENLATSSDLANVRAGGNRNCNVIAYPIYLLPPSPMTATYYSSYSTYGECVVVKLNGATSGTVIQSVGSTPVLNSYIVGQDTAGTYTSTVTLTAIAK